MKHALILTDTAGNPIRVVLVPPELLAAESLIWGARDLAAYFSQELVECEVVECETGFALDDVIRAANPSGDEEEASA